MRKKFFYVTMLAIPLMLYLRYQYVENLYKRRHFRKQIGVYLLDVRKTRLGIYVKDISKYKNLMLEFKNDYTFKFNFKVPFIYDSIGSFQPSGFNIDEWNKIYYKSINSTDPIYGDDVNHCCAEDSTIYINDARPQIGNPKIQEIVFKKINPKADDFK